MAEASSTTTRPGAPLPLLHEVQQALAGELREGVGRSRYRLWFRDVDVAAVDGDSITLAVPTEVHRSWIELAFAGVVREASERVLGRGVRVSVTVGAAQGAKRALRERLPQGPEAWEARLACERPAPSLGSFVTADPDRWEAALLEGVAGSVALAGTPGEAPGGGAPVYLYGEPGSGKSHLLEAVEAQVAGRAPGAALLLGGRRLAQRVGAATRPGAPSTALRALRADLDARRLLLVDGLEAVAGRRATEAELARLLERSALGGPRLVVAGGAHPREVGGLEASLASRLCAGPVLRLAAPGRDLLARVLAARHAGAGLCAPPEVVEAILEATASPHAAVLWLDRWAVASRALGRPLEAASLPEVAPPAATSVGEDVVQRAKRAVAAHFGVDPAVLEQATKARSAALPRAAALYVAWRATSLPLTRLARAFGFRSHSSVSRALGHLKDRRQSDPDLEHVLDALLARL
ncbi:MAG: DnaA ATPase domain-containing protein [Planctomycetia bacterium]